MISLQFGSMTQSIQQQLRAQGLELDDSRSEELQADANAVTRLLIRGFLTQTESAKARHRLCKSIARCAYRVE